MIFSKRSTARIRPWVVVVWIAGLFVGVICPADEIQNRQFLETLPRDRRASLSADLERFDRLSEAEQIAVRRLDKEIAATDPVEQSRYRALLHRYHLWFQGLTEEQRTTLLGTADLDERFRLARKFRLAESSRTNRDGPRVAKIRTGKFGLIAPLEAAFLLRIWNDIPPEKRAEVEKKPPSKLREELRALAKAKQIRFEPFPPDQEKIFDEKLEKDAEFKPFIETMVRNHEKNIREGKVQKKAEAPQKRFERPFAEFLYFDENPPRPVDPARLTRFGESCPEWLHATTDSLSGDDARDYFTLLYRLIYPPPSEMPEPAKVITPAPDASKKPARVKTDTNAPAL